MRDLDWLDDRNWEPAADFFLRAVNVGAAERWSSDRSEKLRKRHFSESEVRGRHATGHNPFGGDDLLRCDIVDEE